MGTHLRLVGAAALGLALVAGVGGWLPADARGRVPEPDGKALYLTGCAGCHGAARQGTARGPSLRGVGAASVDFMLRTGRMPRGGLLGPSGRKPPVYDRRQIAAIVAFLTRGSSATPIPRVDPARGDLVEGGTLYRDNCAACHGAIATGGALSFGQNAPPLAPASPVEIAEAVRVGPGQMPRFDNATFDEHELNSIVRYVRTLADPQDRGGDPLGHRGPIPEGFVAWIGGMGALVLAIRWIGERE